MYRVNVVGSSLNVGTQSAVIPVTAFSPQHQVASSHSQSHNWQKLRENTWITDLINISLNKNFNWILIRPEQVGSRPYERNKSLKILMLRPPEWFWSAAFFHRSMCPGCRRLVERIVAAALSPDSFPRPSLLSSVSRWSVGGLDMGSRVGWDLGILAGVGGDHQRWD